jgi:hypothetical protein
MQLGGGIAPAAIQQIGHVTPKDGQTASHVECMAEGGQS